jgi:hypothetical protein
MRPVILVVVLALAFGACATTKKTNAQKCKEMGGNYNAVTRNCQLQSD